MCDSDDLGLDKKLTPLEMRRVCPKCEYFQTYLDIYHKHGLKGDLEETITEPPPEINNVGKKFGHHDMHALRMSFSPLITHAINEKTRKDGRSAPLKELRKYERSLSSDQWIYFDSQYNTCFLENLDTYKKPIDYFQFYYGEYFDDFIPAKMQDAAQRFDIVFINNRSFWYWLWKDGQDYMESLPNIERVRLKMDITLNANWGLFDKVGPPKNESGASKLSYIRADSCPLILHLEEHPDYKKAVRWVEPAEKDED
jgi:hypothetical protein